MAVTMDAPPTHTHCLGIPEFPGPCGQILACCQLPTSNTCTCLSSSVSSGLLQDHRAQMHKGNPGWPWWGMGDNTPWGSLNHGGWEPMDKCPDSLSSGVMIWATFHVVSQGFPCGVKPNLLTVVIYSLACPYWLLFLPYLILPTPPLLLLDTTFQINYLNPSPYLGGYFGKTQMKDSIFMCISLPNTHNNL